MRFLKKVLAFSQLRLYNHECSAGMAELADAHGSGPCESNFMEVRLLLPAPQTKDTPCGCLFRYYIFADSRSIQHMPSSRIISFTSFRARRGRQQYLFTSLWNISSCILYMRSRSVPSKRLSGRSFRIRNIRLCQSRYQFRAICCVVTLLTICCSCRSVRQRVIFLAGPPPQVVHPG